MGRKHPASAAGIRHVVELVNSKQDHRRDRRWIWAINKGIGLAYALLAQRKEAKGVLLADINLTDEAKLAIKEHTTIESVECDVTRWADLENLIDASIDRFGDVPDVFIASAGVFEPPYSNFWEDPEPLDSNGPVLSILTKIKLTRIAIRSLLGHSKRGVVVIVGSIAGYSKQYPAPIYSATKHAVVGFTRSLGPAQELQSVKVYSLMTAENRMVETPIWTTGSPGSGDRFGIDASITIASEEVARAIDEAVEMAEYPGGTILEVSKDGTRVIPEWNITAPGLIDGQMGKGTTVPPDTIAKAMGPILARTAAERGLSNS
ncbi:hypothetical protein F66182_1003 [Fusarium sp. NRRL 66182]|nr:hypothetical protein F66182_1003 [Fusarium sp. NRRL 66182]